MGSDDTSDVDEYLARFKERRRKLRGLVLDENGDLVTTQELEQRLEDKYGVIVEMNDGVRHFTDEAVQDADPGDAVEATIVEENIPATRAYRMILTDEHPDDLPPVEERAKRQAAFDKAVNAEFERQLEEQDDPFPLEFPPKQSGDESDG